MDQTLVDISLQDDTKEDGRSKHYNLILGIKIFYLIIFFVEWIIFMYWLIYGLHIRNVLKLFVIINHLLLLHDYYHIHVFIKKLDGVVSIYKRIYLIIGIYKIVVSQFSYTFLLAFMHNQLTDDLFLCVFIVHYVYILFWPCMYFYLFCMYGK